ncbi:unnamed protein product [Closterium sp. Naga37s-1]|nr:unnamed protein product [Closterium sp. Naga37s-1]
MGLVPPARQRRVEGTNQHPDRPEKGRGSEGEETKAVVAGAAVAAVPEAVVAAVPEAAGPLSPEERERSAEQGQTGDVELAASPAPMEAAVIAAVVTAAGRRDGQPNGEELTAAAVFAGTSVAGKDADMQGHGQAAGDSQGPTNGAPALLPACQRRSRRGSCGYSQRRDSPEQGWDPAPRDPSWAGFCKGSRHESQSVRSHPRVARPHCPPPRKQLRTRQRHERRTCAEVTGWHRQQQWHQREQAGTLRQQ